jgi:hypothetical protein
MCGELPGSRRPLSATYLCMIRGAGWCRLVVRNGVQGSPGCRRSTRGFGSCTLWARYQQHRAAGAVQQRLARSSDSSQDTKRPWFRSHLFAFDASSALSLALAFVIHTCRAQRARLFPRRSPPTALEPHQLGVVCGLRLHDGRAGPPDHHGPAPPSLEQHRIQRLGLLHPASFNVRVHTKRGKADVRPRTRAARKEWSGPALSAV